jgi:CBS domain-containing membrane protein
VAEIALARLASFGLTISHCDVKIYFEYIKSEFFRFATSETRRILLPAMRYRKWESVHCDCAKLPGISGIMTKPVPDESTAGLPDGEESEIELTDADILDAMQHIPGYLDISTEDFRSIYHLAHRHAVQRLFNGISAGRLMRSPIVPLRPEATLDMAARTLVESGFKGLPVVDDDGRVIGMLTETDFLERLQVGNFLELLLKMLEGSFEFAVSCHEITVGVAMTRQVVTVGKEAGSLEILDAFHHHVGRSMPVVDKDGKLLGMLLKKDFLAAYKLKDGQ